MSEIYLITAEQTLVPLAQQPYATEDLLQALLERYPNLLAGDQIDPVSPRRWLLVKREAEIPDQEDGAGRWSVDHLFLDQDGIPTLVEVKRSTDTRIRREVVGQMLDYAANGVKYWPIEALRSHFERTCENTGTDPDKKVLELIGEASDPEQFWRAVKTNLQAGRIRMLFVADEIPEELRRVVEFLNEQMDPAEVLAIEIKQFASQSMQTLVPRVIGQTAEASDRKSAGGSRTKHQWDESGYFAEMQSRQGPEAVRIARQLLDWAKSNATRVWWGRGPQNGSFIPVIEHGGLGYSPFAVYHGVAKGKPAIEIQFQHFQNKPPFGNEDKRLAFFRLLVAIPGVSLPVDGVTKRPAFPLFALQDEKPMSQFLSALDWFAAEVQSTDSSPS